MSRLGIYSLILTLLGVSLASKCPESRKPHPTSCTIFYNCVNLPGGGYVWAPAKCTNGLVFQPYLRICVLPGDSWTCDILATEPPETTTNQVPELIDSTETSYLGYSEDDVARFSEPMDYYKVEKYTEPADSLQQTVTPYPLIEVTQPNNYVNQIDSTIKNLGLPIAIKHSEDNYLYHFINGQQVVTTPMNSKNDQLQAHLQRLTELIERLTAYQGIGIPLDRQPQTTSTSTSTTYLPAGYYTNINNNNNNNDLNNFPKEKQESALNFLIKNYILKSQAQETKSHLEFNDQEATTVAATTMAPTINLDLGMSGQQMAHTIVAVKDSLNNCQYFTINKYKSIAHQLMGETVELVPCTSGVRLPNSTDCTKYYSCEPTTAKVRQYSCPSNTAFSKYKRLCEGSEYILCQSESIESNARNSVITTDTARTRESSILAIENPQNPCQTVGKHADPTSDTQYYFCYTSGGKTTNLLYQKMSCPKNLIFCQDKNVCTTRIRCEAA